MSLPTDLSRRSLTPELMDQPGLAYNEHAAALAGLARLNWASGTAAQLYRPVARLARMHSATKLRVLDVASGGGDVAARLIEYSRRHGLELEVVGLDCSRQACDIARSRHSAVSGLRFEQTDTIADSLPEGFDVIVCSLFLHHLQESDAVSLLTRMSQAAHLGFAVSDLRRTTLGWWVAQLACRTLSRSPVVHYDGPRSVEGAFSLSEMRSLCAAAGLDEAEIKKCWPWRMLVTWSRK